MMQSSQKPAASSQKADVVSATTKATIVLAPKGRENIAQGEALGSSSYASFKPQRGGIVVVVLALIFGSLTLHADDAPIGKQVRICDGRLLVSIPGPWYTKELSGWRTMALSPKMEGVAFIFTSYFDGAKTNPEDGAKRVRGWATKSGDQIIEQGGKVYFSKNEPFDFDGEKGTIFAWMVSVDRASVMIQVRMPDRWKTTDDGKSVLTKDVPALIKTLHLDRPKSDKTVETIKKTTQLDNDVIYGVDSNDLEMTAAAAKAQETLNEFRQIFKKARDTKDFAIKVKIIRGKYVEYMWANQLKLTDNGFEGVINNTPSRPEFPKLGDAITVKNAEIFDWMYVDNKKPVGAFSVRILQERLKAKENSK